MPFSHRVSSLQSRAGRRLGPWLLLAVLALFASIGGAPAGERVTKYLVQVRLPSLESVRELSAAGFDVAGVNANESLAGVVVTDDELKRLAVLGWSYTVERSNDDTESNGCRVGPGRL